MGLFTQDSSDFNEGHRLLDLALRRFNDIPGLAYSIKASILPNNLQKCCEAFKRVSVLGFPNDPGPFKRLGAFSVLSQVWPPFQVDPADTTDTNLIWGPRLVVWFLPVMAAALEFDDDGPCIRDMLLPTPHFQVEFIAFLRNMANGSVPPAPSPDDSCLLERATATGLMLEACAYVPTKINHSDTSFYSKAAACLEAITEDPLLLDDWRFNDTEFLNLAIGMNLED